MFFFFFFFSSRRRHTRYIGDWSSDVCSSDLGNDGRSRAIARRDFLAGDGKRGVVEPGAVPFLGRSEERRVGKECRSRWSADHYTKKKKKKKHIRDKIRCIELRDDQHTRNTQR